MFTLKMIATSVETMKKRLSITGLSVRQTPRLDISEREAPPVLGASSRLIATRPSPQPLQFSDYPGWRPQPGSNLISLLG